MGYEPREKARNSRAAPIQIRLFLGINFTFAPFFLCMLLFANCQWKNAGL